MTEESFDVLTFIMTFENGSLTDAEVIEGFQHLIDSGIAWQLQGSYGHLADALIKEGWCHT